MTDAKKYGQALFELCHEENKSDSVAKELKLAAAALKDNPDYTSLLDTPALSAAEKTALIDEAFSCFDQHLKNTLKILAEAHSVYLFPSVAAGFMHAFDKAFGIERVEAISAVCLTEEQLSALKKMLEAKTGKNIIIENKTDSSVLGGVKLRYMGIQIDSTLKTKLDGLRDVLADTII